MRNKRGSEKYYILMSMILGILILAISLFYLFHEYFTSEDLDWETCRQSIVLRNMAPERDLLAGSLSLKDQFPLKCKTQVINIADEKIGENINKIRETIISSWYLMGNGEFRVFPSTKWGSGEPCMVVARIHVDEKFKEFYKKSENTISLKKLFEDDYKNQNLMIYLKNLNDVDPFKWFVEFNRNGKFKVESFGNDWDRWINKELVGERFPKPGVYFPENLDPDSDLLIIVSSPSYKLLLGDAPKITEDEADNFNDPYLVLVHSNNLNALKKTLAVPTFLEFAPSHNVQVCDSFEIIPA